MKNQSFHKNCKTNSFYQKCTKEIIAFEIKFSLKASVYCSTITNSRLVCKSIPHYWRNAINFIHNSGENSFIECLKRKGEEKIS